MLTLNPRRMMVQERNAVRHALMTERMRARRYQRDLACATDKKLRWRCGRNLHASLDRAAKLALELIDMGEAMPMMEACTEFDGSLLDAMDSNLRNCGTPVAARDCTPSANAARQAT